MMWFYYHILLDTDKTPLDRPKNWQTVWQKLKNIWVSILIVGDTSLNIKILQTALAKDKS